MISGSVLCELIRTFILSYRRSKIYLMKKIPFYIVLSVEIFVLKISVRIIMHFEAIPVCFRVQCIVSKVVDIFIVVS